MLARSSASVIWRRRLPQFYVHKFGRVAPILESSWQSQKLRRIHLICATHLLALHEEAAMAKLAQKQ